MDLNQQLYQFETWTGLDLDSLMEGRELYVQSVSKSLQRSAEHALYRVRTTFPSLSDNQANSVLDSLILAASDALLIHVINKADLSNFDSCMFCLRVDPTCFDDIRFSLEQCLEDILQFKTSTPTAEQQHELALALDEFRGALNLPFMSKRYAYPIAREDIDDSDAS